MVITRASGLLLFLISASILAGCSDKDQQTVVDQSRSAMQGLSAGMSKAWTSLNDKARNLDTKSSEHDLESMKTQMSQLADEAQNKSKSEAQAAREQWQRLDLAEKVKNLQKDTDAKLKELEEDRKTATKNIEETNKAYKEAQQKLAAAQKAYDEATKKAEAAWKAVTTSN